MRLAVIDTKAGTIRVLECQGRKYSDVATYTVRDGRGSSAWDPALVEIARAKDPEPMDGSAA